MAFLDVLKKNITTASQTAAEKAKLAKDIVVLKNQIRQDNKEIKDSIYAIGEAYLAAHEDDYEEAYAEFITKIKDMKADIKAKEEEIEILSAKSPQDEAPVDFEEIKSEAAEAAEEVKEAVEEIAEEAAEKVEEAVEAVEEAAEAAAAE